MTLQEVNLASIVFSQQIDAYYNITKSNKQICFELLIRFCSIGCKIKSLQSVLV